MMEKGFTLTELIIGMLIASILILTIGVMSGVGISSYNKLSKQAEAYNDLYFGVDLIERSIRRAHTVSVDTTQNTLTVDSFIFKADNGDLVYIDTANANKRNVIVSGATNLQFVPTNPSTNLYKATISDSIRLDEKNTIDLNVSVNVMRRNG